MKFLGELKRRNVYRAIIIYGVGSWILVQVGIIAARSVQAPEWAGAVLLVLLTLGYPFFIWLAWTYEWTETGFKKTADVDPADSISEKTAKKMDQYIMVMLVVVAGVATLEKFVPEPEGYQEMVQERQQERPRHTECAPRLSAPASAARTRASRSQQSRSARCPPPRPCTPPVRRSPGPCSASRRPPCSIQWAE